MVRHLSHLLVVYLQQRFPMEIHARSGLLFEIASDFFAVPVSMWFTTVIMSHLGIDHVQTTRLRTTEKLKPRNSETLTTPKPQT